MSKDSRSSFEESHNKLHSNIAFANRFDPTKSTYDDRFVRISRELKLERGMKHKSLQSISELKSAYNVDNKKTHSVQLYKPIYVARRSNYVNRQFSYDEGDEFELISKVNEDYLRTIHLRTNTKCTIHRIHLRLDLETPLRLVCNDRGIIHRCLLHYNVPGAYLIRRSKSMPDSFVLSISQISNSKGTDDWHYLICVDPLSHCFYFAQEAELGRISFSSFQKLIYDDSVLKAIPLSTMIPFRIEFEEDLWHIPRRHLEFEYCIGKGEYGEVWCALWENGNRIIPVAVKKLHLLRYDKSKLDSFIHEIETMKQLRNNYIVAFYGIAKDYNTNEALLVTELMRDGDLKNWLISCKNVPDERIIISFASDICCGMLFLEQNSRVHRDLACRNLLIDIARNTIKIADFGLSTLITKDNFVRRKETYLQKLPIRWTAPEILNDPAVCSIKSDVWSFGIVLIEIWLKGANPYPEETAFASIRALVLGGYVHKKPLKCSNQFYNRLILPCLCFEPNERPCFKLLVQLLKQWNKEKVDYERLNNLRVKFQS